LFYTQNVHFAIISNITHDIKTFLFTEIGRLPQLEKMRLDIEIHASKHIDLDNRAYFWRKLFMDVLKTPTSRQIINSQKKGRKPIITTNTIVDDSTQYVDEYKERFFYGGNQLIFRIYGRVKTEQKELDLFFI
jgi:cytochrome b involved in lipid metabolism